MNPIEEIITALLLLRPDDLDAARRYIQWMKVRRKINDRFYFAAHWVHPKKTPGVISQALKPLLVSHPRAAHWL